jgi:alpha-galactosidase
MWRMADDFWDSWDQILHMFKYAELWQGVGGPGHWPDCDMLQIGKLSKRGPVGPERYSRFTNDELYTHMTFWSIFRSPLIIGGNLPENRDIELKLLTNKEVLDVNQHGENPKELYFNKDKNMVWYSHIPGSRDIYAAFFNLSDDPNAVKIDFSGVGLKGKVKVRDLWKKQDAGLYKDGYQQTVNKHGAALLRLSPE